MCAPAAMMAGGLAMSGAQAYMGYQQGQAEAAYAYAAAASGYAGAVEEYNRDVEFQQRQTDWQWNDYARRVSHRQEIIEADLAMYEATIDSAISDVNQKQSAIQSGLLQLRDATMKSIQDMWVTHNIGQSTRQANAAARGVEGNTVQAELNAAFGAMARNEDAAFTNLQWSVQQGMRDIDAAKATAAGRIAQARPRPIEQVAMPTPLPTINPPSWQPYGLQSQAGAMQGYNTSFNSLIGGASGALGSVGTYYSQTTPPGTGYQRGGWTYTG